MKSCMEVATTIQLDQYVKSITKWTFSLYFSVTTFSSLGKRNLLVKYKEYIFEDQVTTL